MPRVLAIIPARGGSKGVPHKNIRLLAGKPLIGYTIGAAIASRHLTDFVTSTDDDEIATVAKSFGSTVIRRPSKLATDDAPMDPTIEHALNECETQAGRYDYVLVLQPTAPFRTSDDIDNSIELLEKSGETSLTSVYLVEDAHPARMYRLDNDRLVPYEQEPLARLRQTLPPVYHRNGAIYGRKTVPFRTEHTLLGSSIIPYIMPRSRSINIDDELDFAFAEYLMERRQTVDS